MQEDEGEIDDLKEDDENIEENADENDEEIDEENLLAVKPFQYSIKI